jgi:hypothetical protein
MNRSEAIACARDEAIATGKTRYAVQYRGTSHPRIDNTWVVRRTPMVLVNEEYVKVEPTGEVTEMRRDV